MCSDITRSVVLTVLVAALLGASLFVVDRYARWPAPESPPRQGEALDSYAYKQGEYIHSSAALARVVREPFNTWTNLAFVFAGAQLLVRRGLLVRRQSGMALLIVGVGSFLYHASSSRTLRHLDVGAMYWIYILLIILSVGAFSKRFRRWCHGPGVAWIWIVPLVAASITVCRNVRIGGWKPFDLSQVTGVAAAFAVVALLVTARRLGGWRFSLSALVVFGAAVACQIGDRPGGWLCDPEGLIQAHGMWHILGSVACWMTCIQLSRAWGDPPNQPAPHNAGSRPVSSDSPSSATPFAPALRG